jgi:hypothetical protein
VRHNSSDRRRFGNMLNVDTQGHAKAMQHVRGYYLEWRVERLRLVVKGGAKGWDIVNWVDQGPSEHP